MCRESDSDLELHHVLTEGVEPHHRERKFDVLKVLHSSSLIGATKKLTMRRMSKEKDEIDEQTQTLPVGDDVRGEKLRRSMRKVGNIVCIWLGILCCRYFICCDPAAEDSHRFSVWVGGFHQTKKSRGVDGKTGEFLLNFVSLLSLGEILSTQKILRRRMEMGRKFE